MKTIMLWLLVTMYYCTNGQPLINKMEYFFDADPGIGQAINIPINAAQNIDSFNFQANTNALAPGLHKLYIRSRDANGRWSLSSNTTVYKEPVLNKSFGDIIGVEYFFDIDPGFGNGTLVNVEPSQNQLNLIFNVEIDALSVGIHWFYVRSINEFGNWGVTARQLVYKAPPLDSIFPAIVKMEYFINNDPGFGNAVPLVFNPADSLANFTFPANIAGFSSGVQTLYIRSKDGAGKWSLTAMDTFTLNHTPPTQGIVVNSLIIPANGNPGGTVSPFALNETPVLNSNPELTVCAGKAIKLAFDPRGNFSGANSFRIELSNQNGNFSNPIAIGQISGTTAQEITCNLPRHLTPGGAYKIRVVSNIPSITGDPNQNAITINDINIGKDTTVIVACINNRINLTQLYKTTGLTAQWNTSPANNAPIGEYRLIVNNSTNCPDTAFASVVLPIARWTGAISDDWHTAGNWDIQKVPDAQTHIFIETDATKPCIIKQAGAAAASIQLKQGAVLQNTVGFGVAISGRCTFLPTQ